MIEGTRSVAGGMNGPVELVTGVLAAVTLMLAVMCLFQAAVYFQKYRRNPIDYPIGKSVLLLVMAVILFVLLFIYQSGQP